MLKNGFQCLTIVNLIVLEERPMSETDQDRADSIKYMWKNMGTLQREIYQNETLTEPTPCR